MGLKEMFNTLSGGIIMIQSITYFIHSWGATTPVVAGQSSQRFSTLGRLQAVNSPPRRRSGSLPVSNFGKLGLLFIAFFLLLLAPLQAKAGTWTSVGPNGGTARVVAI